MRHARVCPSPNLADVLELLTAASEALRSLDGESQQRHAHRSRRTLQRLVESRRGGSHHHRCRHLSWELRAVRQARRDASPAQGRSVASGSWAGQFPCRPTLQMPRQIGGCGPCGIGPHHLRICPHLPAPVDPFQKWIEVRNLCRAGHRWPIGCFLPNSKADWPWQFPVRPAANTENRRTSLRRFMILVTAWAARAASRTCRRW